MAVAETNMTAESFMANREEKEAWSARTNRKRRCVDRFETVSLSRYESSSIRKECVLRQGARNSFVCGHGHQDFKKFDQC